MRDDPHFGGYELRGCLGSTKWKDDEAVVLGNNLPGILQFLSDDGLVASGSHVWYKVFVKLTTGNEKSSRAVKVTRP